MTASKIVAAAASGVGGAGLDVDEVFSTFLYEGNGGTQSITNNIDLSGEGGLVWIKQRNATRDHALFDTERGTGKYIRSNVTTEEATQNLAVSAFNSNGFSLGGANGITNNSSQDYVAWTFRKAPNFFDVVTYTGNSTAGRTVSHNLGSVPGCIFVKNLTDDSEDWCVYHRGIASDAETDCLFLNATDAALDNDAFWNDTAPTSTQFTLGNSTKTNRTGHNFVAYLFAHNNNDGGFGPDSDADIIKCDSYTGTGDYTANEVNLGFEPQWLLIKKATADGSNKGWVLVDNMRGWPADGGATWVYPNTSDAESTASSLVKLTSTGFKPNGSSLTASSNDTFIYVAIRRGPLATPDDATKVFNINANTVSGVEPVSGFVTDFAIANYASQASPWYLTTRLQGNQFLSSNVTDAEATINHTAWDRMDGAYNANMTNYQIWHWKRAPGYFDVVAYTGTGSARTVSHNLGVAPEMVWIKNRGATENWVVYHSGIDSSAPEKYFLRLNQTSARIDIDGGAGSRFNRTAPTTSVFTVGTDGDVNGNGVAYISYHFATLAGVSKVASVSHTSGSATNVDCGFSSGARFVLIKQTDDTGAWYVFDSVRGIIAENDAGLYLNANTAQQSADWIDPLASGFTMTSGAWNTGTYIFYAIA